MKPKSPKPPLPKHPLAVAFEEWKKANPKTFIAASLGRENPDILLGNRLEAAFFAGSKSFEDELRKLWADALK